jgi:NAD(P)H-flavin reductase
MMKIAPELYDFSQAFFTSYEQEGKLVSFFGDGHPYYAGSVVKAMASAKNGYQKIADLFQEDIKKAEQEDYVPDRSELESFFEKLDHEFKPTVVHVEKLTPTITEIIVHAPAAARNFRPGEFYRMQNYDTDPIIIDGKPMSMEALAMTGAWTDEEKGLLSMIVLEIGASSRLVQYVKPGQKLVVMGPTGAPTEIPFGETVLLAGGGLGNAVLFSISKALKKQGCNVMYFAGYKQGEDVFKMDEIESSTDKIVWCTDTGAEIQPRRSQDVHFRGNIIQAMLAYAEGRAGEQIIPMKSVSRIIAIGSDGMMNAVKEARRTVLHPFLGEHIAIGSINSPMQCMMKEICAQCLQKHVDPETGKEITPVFSCFNQDQELDRVDFPHLKSRLRQNSVLEKLGNSWLTHLLSYSQA